MSNAKVKVTVKGKAGSVAHSVARLIANALTAQNAEVQVNEDETDLFSKEPIRTMEGLTVDLKHKQLPRVETNSLKVKVSQEEWIAVQIIRGRRMTGLVDHKTQDGLYYFWCWGSQPDGANRVTGKTPLEAAEAHMKVYERWEGGTQQMSITPIRKARAA
jgi:hypothetical protein